MNNHRKTVIEKLQISFTRSPLVLYMIKFFFKYIKYNILVFRNINHSSIRVHFSRIFGVS